MELDSTVKKQILSSVEGVVSGAQRGRKKEIVVLADSLRKTLEAASTRPGTEPRIGNGAGTTNPPLHLLQQERATSAQSMMNAPVTAGTARSDPAWYRPR
jgi:hypothetical protein